MNGAAVFVDTNVFVYAKDPNEPTKQPLAASWIDRLWREGRGRTSIQVVSEFYVTATRKKGAPPAKAWEDAIRLMSWNPLPIDATVIRLARETELRYRIGWWDSLIVAAAELQDCATVLSEDLQDGGVYGGVTVRSPFTLALNEPITPYAAADRASGYRHPARGRPRKVA